MSKTFAITSVDLAELEFIIANLLQDFLEGKEFDYKGVKESFKILDEDTKRGAVNVINNILEDEEFFKRQLSRNHLSHRVAYLAIKTLVHSQKQPMTAVQMDKKLTYDEMKEVSDKYRELAEKVANDE